MLFFRRVQRSLHLLMCFRAPTAFFCCFLLTQVKRGCFMSRYSFFHLFFCSLTAWLLSSSSYPPVYQSQTALICSHLIQRIPSGFWAQSSRTSKFCVLPSLSSFVTYVHRKELSFKDEFVELVYYLFLKYHALSHKTSLFNSIC